MGNWLGLPLMALAAVLQVTFVPQIRILGGEPNLVFLMVLVYAVRAPLEQGVAWAFAGGILLDLLTSAPTGGSVLGLLLLVLLIDVLRAQFVGAGFLMITGLVIFGSLTFELVLLVLTVLGGHNIRLFDLLRYAVAPSIAYNLVLVWPVYWFMRRACAPPMPVA